MKKFIAAIPLLIALPAVAQSGVTIYGIIDNGVEYVSNVNAAGQSVVKMPANTSITSRLGFKGTEDLGGGMTANFVLENGFTPDTGGLAQGGRLFGRQSNVSLGTPYGSFILGRQYSMLFYSMLSADVLGPNLFGSGALDSYIPNTRVDNTVGYMHKIANTAFGATYSLGRDTSAAGGPAATNCAGETASDTKACKEWSLYAKYDVPGWGVSVGYDKLYGAPGVVFGGTSALRLSDYYDARTNISGYVDIGNLRLGIGWIGRKNVSAASYKQDLAFIGASYWTGPWSYEAELFSYTKRNSPDDSMMLASRITYYLSKRTALYVTGGYLINKGNAANTVDGVTGAGVGMNQVGIASGIRHTF
ncbi:porin [Herbaspirillum lusitanum]|uniref:porin n=1 Tax=Herbaspirillum lusitanum TaxID=213312 RepID=UPI0002F9F1E5|nr:porin [Herbaspirillum lusitanum]